MIVRLTCLEIIYLFEMSEDVTKIDMKQLAIFLDHNIVRVSISDA
jgi:hypothetical protein